MKRKAKLLLTLTMLTAMALTACSAANDAAALENTRWVLQSYGPEGSLQDVLQEAEISAKFDGAEGQISGSAGCNTYFAGFEVQGSKLSVSALAVTEMFCVTPEGVMEQEQRYVSTLATAESFQIRDGQLHISCSGGQVLIFSAE